MFGNSHLDEVASEYNLDILARIPIDPSLASLCDRGAIELMEGDYAEAAADTLESKLGN